MVDPIDRKAARLKGVEDIAEQLKDLTAAFHQTCSEVVEDEAYLTAFINVVYEDIERETGIQLPLLMSSVSFEMTPAERATISEKKEKFERELGVLLSEFKEKYLDKLHSFKNREELLNLVTSITGIKVLDFESERMTEQEETKAAEEALAPVLDEEAVKGIVDMIKDLFVGIVNAIKALCGQSNHPVSGQSMFQAEHDAEGYDGESEDELDEDVDNRP